MVSNGILHRIPSYGATLAPEWGCGGIFGLMFTGEVLYYTVAFNAVAVFHHVDGETVSYEYDLVGVPPRSGGDTYNVVAVVDDEIYFGGWVNAPARIVKTARSAVIDFSNKYSHIHAYNVAERRVRLVWVDGIGHPSFWAGEVTDLLYNPLRDSLLAARGDGHDHLGVYEVDRRSGRARRVSKTRVLKGTIYMDHACFTLHHGWGGAPGIHCVELDNPSRSFTVEVRDVASVSVDGGGIFGYRSGDIAAAYTKLYVALRGGLMVFDPLGGEDPVFIRLLDFHYSPYGPLRSNILPVGGGLLIAFNAQAHSSVRGTDELPSEQIRASRRPPAPTLLVYIFPPMAKIVAVLGARVTSMALAGEHILVATSTGPNLERYDATMVDHCQKTIVPLSVDLLEKKPPPVHISLEGWMVDREAFGGIPLTGYNHPLARIRATHDNVLEINLYDLGGKEPIEKEKVGIKANNKPEKIDLTSHRGLIASFKLRDRDPHAKITIELE